MTKKTSHAAQTATEAYASARRDIARLLDVLDMELTRHDEGFKADPRDRTYIGTLEQVRSELINTVAFVAGMETDEVDAFLDDAV